MYRPRIIPVLLLDNDKLVKTVKFSNPKYIGDPINAVRIFNDLNADELVLLDISASRENRCINLDLVKEIGEEANMPFSVGGGIKTLESAQKLLSYGAERVVIGTEAVSNPDFVKKLCESFGSSTVAVCIDYKKDFLGRPLVYAPNKKAITQDPIKMALLMEEAGVGEIILQSFSKDGTMSGYDVEFLKNAAKKVTIPLVGLGGAAKKEDLEKLYRESGLNGLGAGSLFIYKGQMKGVLINYPSSKSYSFSYECS
jgi:imidazole glycerol-phosphate synthase subunit HisF